MPKKYQIKPGDTEVFKTVAEAIQKNFAQMSRGLADTFEPFIRDSSRARKLLELVDSLDEEEADAAFDKIQNEIDSVPPLTARQILYLILEARGVDTSELSKSGKILGKSGGQGKRGSKSDIYNALASVVNEIEKSDYKSVLSALGKKVDDVDDNVSGIEIISCDLPGDRSGKGALRYKDSKGRDKSIGYSGVEKHLKQIRKTLIHTNSGICMN